MERHPPGYDYQARFPHLREVFGGEGGVVYSADGPEGPAVISDEGTMASFLLEEDYDSLVSIRLFTSTAARDAFVARLGTRHEGG